jgi:hypothetical protein
MFQAKEKHGTKITSMSQRHARYQQVERNGRLKIRYEDTFDA